MSDRFRRLVGFDIAIGCSALIGFGVILNQIDQLSEQVKDLQEQSRGITPMAAERLARVEARVELLLDNQAAMSAKIDRLVEREGKR